MSSGQGGPVVIESVETTTLVNGNSISPRFKIKISNLKTGTVLSAGAYDRVCTGTGVTAEDFHQVELTDLSFSNFGLGDFDCNRKTLEISDEGNETSFFYSCKLLPGKLSRESGVTYTTPLTVEIKYGYQTNIKKEIEIKEIK